jgi:uncharacterized protein YecE (DUF72 family)
MSQLTLFGDDEPVRRDTSRSDPGSGSDSAARSLSIAHADAERLAGALPTDVRFGTSSWAFPGWAGLVYSTDAAQASLARDGLREYARHPLLRTVGIDRSYYAPVPVEELRRYADQLPAGFPCCAKAPAAVTSRALPGTRGSERAAPNPDFLNADLFIESTLEPFALAFRDHCGPFVIEFPPALSGQAQDAPEFIERLDHFLGAVPRDFKYAVELRDEALLTGAYRSVLARHGVAHVYNYWSAMPMPGVQAATIPPEVAPFVVVRLLLRPGTWYEDQRERFRPFNRIVAPDEAMRAEVAGIVAASSRRGQPVYVLVNNKAEGSAPLTVRALAEAAAAALREDQSPKRSGSHFNASSSGGPM